MQMRAALGVPVIALVLSACSHAGSSLPPVTFARSTTAVFVMHWPGSTSTQTAARRPQFISPSTRSVTITVNNLQQKAIANAPTPSATPATTSIKIDAPVGTDQFLIQAWDQPGGAGSMVGEVNVVQQVIAGKANVISATLNGVCANITIAPAASQPFVLPLAEPVGTVYEIVGPQPETFIDTPRDADGNAILAPGAVPAITMTSRVAKVSKVGTSNTFTVTPTTIADVNGSGDLTATSLDCLQNNNPIFARINIAPRPAIYIPNNGNSTVTIYDENGTQIHPSGTFPGLLFPQGAVFDPLNGRIYVNTAITGGATVREFDQSGHAISTTGTFPGMQNPEEMAFDPINNRIYVADFMPPAIHVYDPNGNSIATYSASNPVGIVFDPNNQYFYIPDEQFNTMLVMDQNGNHISTTGSFPNLFNPEGITLDTANGNIYVANLGNSTITAYDASGNQISFFGGAFPDMQFPHGIAYDSANGNLYVTQTPSGGPKVTLYTDFGTENFPATPFLNLNIPEYLTIAGP